MAAHDTTNPGLVALPGRRRKRTVIATWAPLVALVAALSTAAPFVFSAINWPWESKADAAAAHAKLEASQNKLREQVEAWRREQREDSRTVIEEIRALRGDLKRRRR